MKPLKLDILDELQQFIDSKMSDDEMGGESISTPGPSLEVEVKPEGGPPMGEKKCPTCGHEM